MPRARAPHFVLTMAAASLALVVAGAPAQSVSDQSLSSQSVSGKSRPIQSVAVVDEPTTSPSASPSATSAPQPTTEPSATSTPTDCPLCAPDNYSPKNGATFNHPFSAKDRGKIRRMLLRSINSVPGGGSIRAATFSINDWDTTRALMAARKRGVSVQIIADWHTAEPGVSPSFLALQKAFGTATSRPGMSADRVSFVRTCTHSCRYRSGNMHQKMYLFSQVGDTKWVTMGGSANMTMMAVNGQWNHLTTYSNFDTYSDYLDIFNEMKLDRPQDVPGRIFNAGGINSWVFPRPNTSAGNDPMMDALDRVRCTGVKNAGLNGRTVIRIGMYSWYNDRGIWLAKNVRSLWDRGCNVAIEFALMSKPVRGILYNPAGRGRIPMKQVGVYATDGTVLKYLHHKYVAISGNYGGDPTSFVVFAGTTNFANLGLYSDEMTQRWNGYGVYSAYMADFRRIWVERNARTPSPISSLGSDLDGRLGTGRYTNLSRD